MNTDEYEISLGREIAVCRNIIGKIGKELARLEQRHQMTTAEFAKVARDGGGPDLPDRGRWLEEYASLLSWQQRLRDYDEALHAIRQRRREPSAGVTKPAG